MLGVTDDVKLEAIDATLRGEVVVFLAAGNTEVADMAMELATVELEFLILEMTEFDDTNGVAESEDVVLFAMDPLGVGTVAFEAATDVLLPVLRLVEVIATVLAVDVELTFNNGDTAETPTLGASDAAVLPASDSGQTVVDRAMMEVTTTGVLDAAGQSFTEDGH